MKVSLKNIAVIFSLYTNVVFSGSMGGVDNDVEPCWGPAEACSSPRAAIPYTQNRVAAFSIGPAWSRNGQSQTLTILPNEVNHYAAKIQNNVFPYMEAFLGREKQWSQILYTQLGLEIGGGSAARFRGTVTSETVPQFTTETYSYNVNELRVLAKGKILFDLNFYETRPFLTAGIGIGFNHSYGYAVKPTSASTALFKSNTQTALATTLGVGFEEVINDHWHAAIGYEYANWGKSQLDAAAHQITTPGLVVNNVYVNTVLLSLLYFS